MVTSERDRGQVLLIAAITLSVILLGMAVLLNAAVTTEVRAPDDPSTDLEEAERLAADVERGVAGMAARINREGSLQTDDEVRTALRENLSTFAEYATHSLGLQRATSVELQADELQVTENGTYVADGHLNDSFLLDGEDDGVHHSHRINESEGATVLGLEVLVNASTLEPNASDTLGIQLWDDADGCSLISLERGGSNITVRNQSIDCDANQSDISNSAGSEQLCEISDDDTVHLAVGAEPTDPAACQVAAFDPIKGLSFRNPDAALGGYRYLVGPGPTFGGGYHDGPADGAPYAVPVPWTVEFELAQYARASERVATTTAEVYAEPANVAGMGVPWG